MSWKRTFIALAALALLVAGALWFEIWWQDRKLEEHERDSQVFPWDPASVAAFEISYAGQRYRLERTNPDAEGRGKGWSLTAPEQTPANPNIITALLWQVRAMRRIEILESADPVRFGLDANEAASIQVETDDGQSRRVYVGEEVPTRPLVYARLEQGPVFLVDESVLLATRVDTVRLRDLRLASFLPHMVSTMEWLRPGNREPVLVERQWEQRPEWLLKTIPAGPADKVRVEEVLTTLSQIFGRQIVAEGSRIEAEPELLAAYGLDPPRAQVRVVEKRLDAPDGAEDDTQELVVEFGGLANPATAGEPPPEEYLVYARGPNGAVMIVDGNLLRKVNAPTQDWRDGRLARFHRWNLTRVEIEGQHGVHWVLERNEDRTWTCPQVPGRIYSWEEVDPLLDELVAPKFQAFITDLEPDHPELGFEEFHSRVTFHEGGLETNYLLGARYKDAFRTALVDGEEIGLIKYGEGISVLRAVDKFFKLGPESLRQPSGS